MMLPRRAHTLYIFSRKCFIEQRFFCLEIAALYANLNGEHAARKRLGKNTHTTIYSIPE